ncbi:MAG: hypothetical protein KME15_26395 [Drouetiella hepatica Uher 2000/2452]|jgi:hypothetical protein|uniref:Uncharacterized protein n=1 Tax=Drouetiella hepatica Uher 2000/2452 TaxID=904376 RepID=A0A951US60_9CYAN|nr:hypothetical protein [Drouetiella hepatica Uher 2000/2452]
MQANNSATQSKTEIALGNLMAGTLSVAGMLTIAYQPWYVGIPIASISSFLGFGVAQRHKKYELTLVDYWQGFEGFCDEGEEFIDPAFDWIGKRAQPLYQKYVVPKIPPVAAALLDAASAEKDDSWLTQKMIRASKFVLGGKGTGKSVWIRYEARRFKAENPTGTVRIVDLHALDGDDEQWLPGLDPDSYLAATVAEGMGFIRELLQVGRDRIASKSTDHPEYKLIVDEFQAFRNRASNEEKSQIDEAIQFSQDELRKYKVNVTLTSKSRKKGMTGQDSSVIDQMDFMALGNAIADPNNVVPYDINAKELTAKRQAVAALPGCRYACVYRPMDGEPEIKVVPDDLPERSACITFGVLGDELSEDDLWLEENRPTIEEMRDNGLSLSKIADSLGIKRENKNTRYQLLKSLVPPTTLIPQNSGAGSSF